MPRQMDAMKAYRNKQLGFEIAIPKEWSLPRGEAIKTPFGESIGFGCGVDENFNFQIGWSIPEPIDQTEHEFRRYAQEKHYTELELGRITVGDRDHVWARYRMGTGDWAKKYLINFGETEYAITANCFDQHKFVERENIWDAIVMSFRLILPVKPHKTTNVLERMKQAAQFAERGQSYFKSGNYQKALEQFEKGKMVTHEFTWNFLGASMTIMQMIETGAIPEDQMAMAIAKAEKDLQACLLISPREQDYLNALQGIQDFKKKHNI